MIRTEAAFPPERGVDSDHGFWGSRVMLMLEISVILLSIVAFTVFDLYVRACERL
jgi:hypothetical protein